MRLKTKELGQATVELALLMPLLALFLLFIVQVGIVARQHVLVANAARAGAREASVNNDYPKIISVVKEQAPGAKIEMQRPPTPGQYLTVKVSDEVESNIPIISIVFPVVTVKSEMTMRVEK